MLGISHLLISGTSASLLLGTADPAVISVAAIAGLLPDVDISTSPAGRVFPWISAYFEATMPHRSCTHSLMASAVVAIAVYAPVLLFFPNLLTFAHALTIGYFFGWFADVFTRGGVEMFWPSPTRCVCPGNRNLRLRTGSNAEYFVLVLLVVIALFIFSINSSGGVFTQFNRLIASPSGVTHIYNESGSSHKIIANITGVRVSDRAKIQGQYLLIQQQGTGFIVMEDTGKLYKAGTDPDSQILTESITADVGASAITNIEAITLNDEPVGATLARFNRAGAMVFISGQLSVDDFDSSAINLDPYQFPFIKTSPSSINLEAAPLAIVQRLVGEEFASGQLQVRSIVSSQ